MKIEYDAGVDALYIHVQEPVVPVARSVVVDEGRVVDLDASGNPVGIELLDVSEGVRLLDLVQRFGLVEVQEDFERLERLPPEQIAAG
jgi:uncharacterized protein YuzE